MISCQSSSSRSYNPDLYQDNECYLDVKISSRPRSSKERLRDRQHDRQRSNNVYASTQAYANPQPTVEFSDLSDLEISDISSDNENVLESCQPAEYNPNDYLNTTYRSDYQYYADDNAIRYKPIKIKEFEMQKPIIFKGQQNTKPVKSGQKSVKPETYTVAKPVKIKSGPTCVQTISKFTKPAQSSQNRYARKTNQKLKPKSTKYQKAKQSETISDSPENGHDEAADVSTLKINTNLPKPLFHCQFCSLPFHSIISLRRHEMIFCTKDWTKLS